MVLFGIEPIAEDASDTIKLAKLVEKYHYDFMWVPESQLIWRELYSYLAICAQHTTRAKIASGVTNLTTRHPTVVASGICTINEISKGRAVLGLGRGDSAVRLMAHRPQTIEEFVAAVNIVKALCSGKEVEYRGRRIRLTWANGSVPIYIAAYGPRMLRFAGQVADGVILQIGEPNIIKWALGHVRQGAEESGRDINDIDVVAFTACHVSDDMEKNRRMVRWYPATVSNHVFSLLSRYARADLPPQLLVDLERIRGKYNYWDHDVVDSQHSKLVTDRLVDSFTLSGTPERCVGRIKELEKAGVTNINLYLPTGESVNVASKFAEEVMSRFR